MKQQFIDEIKKRAKPLHTNDDLDAIVEAIGDTRIVLLGEATHGTAEFYNLRTELTKKLITEKGFTTLSISGNWVPFYEVTRYIKGHAHQNGDLAALLPEWFNEFPTWTRANEEMIPLFEWLREYNQGLPEAEKIGFYGDDLKSLWLSLDEVIQSTERLGSPELVDLARKIQAGLATSQENPQVYGLNAIFFNQSCEAMVTELHQKLAEARGGYKQNPSDDELADEINALVLRNSEHYWRSMAMGGPDNWNIRARHMVQVINRLIERQGENGKIIVWGHNTHMGDARATEGMPAEGFVNVAQLMREHWGDDNVYAVGFSTNTGKVISAKDWNHPFEEVEVRAAHSGSWDALLHEAGAEDKILIFGKDEPIFSTPLPQRAIGVVYHPDHQAEYQTYVASRLSDRYNALIYVDHTHAVKPLLPKGLN
ncbi:hypothetical protein BEP19_03155 [Ammoniphilus oxalaticus]|uniref:Protein-L-isoaspartate O-methyltransferase n=1 Tax=Ammoniphilus oxalaticus TaxID=66863 RepID=A0A419SNX9_9BACL|nr:erythromycin esterase family protein [Ammoniphilus oxalaticus]RKD25939.1 hypothetical protein BEP19_03155 [Ammoniphilus oxalaticus]